MSTTEIKAAVGEKYARPPWTRAAGCGNPMALAELKPGETDP
jgi:hypothetical protein